MDVVEISGQWYVIRWEDELKQKFSILDGPYPEKHWAISMSRLKEI